MSSATVVIDTLRVNKQTSFWKGKQTGSHKKLVPFAKMVKNHGSIYTCTHSPKQKGMNCTTSGVDEVWNAQPQ